MQLNRAAPLLYGWMFEDINVGVLIRLDSETDVLSA